MCFPYWIIFVYLCSLILFIIISILQICPSIAILIPGIVYFSNFNAFLYLITVIITALKSLPFNFNIESSWCWPLLIVFSHKRHSCRSHFLGFFFPGSYWVVIDHILEILEYCGNSGFCYILPKNINVILVGSNGRLFFLHL